MKKLFLFTFYSHMSVTSIEITENTVNITVCMLYIHIYIYITLFALIFYSFSN